MNLELINALQDIEKEKALAVRYCWRQLNMLYIQPIERILAQHRTPASKLTRKRERLGFILEKQLLLT